MATRTRKSKSRATERQPAGGGVEEIDVSTLKKPEPWDIEAARKTVLELMKRPGIKKWLKDMAER